MGFIRMTISLPEKTKEKLEQIAKEEMRPVSNMIAYLIEKYDQERKQ